MDTYPDEFGHCADLSVANAEIRGPKDTAVARVPCYSTSKVDHSMDIPDIDVAYATLPRPRFSDDVFWL